MTRPTHAVVAALAEASDLVDAARTLAKTAKANAMPETARQCRAIAHDLDGVRTRLIEDGDEFVPEAIEHIEAATDYLPAHAAHIGRGVRRQPGDLQ